ncbi:Sir2 family NAD+-dependent deacetylase [Neptuniibacter marinus]|uniref:Sir2 family NAD+-dependent deacetylase n=1 Tax=Neptuniibacter marinus TaxID=1806670 RepID=UPI003B58D85E
MAIESIVILTGAGISAESGIQTFRASDGLWEDHKVDDVATPEAFERNPRLVHRFYNERRNQLLSPKIKPNLGHYALAELEEKFLGRILVVTQNIDNLHERAGSKNLLHMHGELLNLRCKETGVIYPVDQESQPEDLCQCCGSSGNLRPDIVWFGELPMHMPQIYNALEECDLFISIGTSGHVYPAAGFVEIANAAGALTVELNLEPSRVGTVFDHKIYGLASEIVPEFVNEILCQI